MKLAIIGAQGMVGRVLLEVIEEKNFPFKELYLVASEKSLKKQILFKGKKYTIISIEEALALKPHIAIFSAGGEVSKKWALVFAENGIKVIDNSSVWRMDPDKKLIVPEINAHVLSKKDMIISNPNCSTIELVMVIYPLHLRYKIKRIIISTYQAVSGSGKKALDQLEKEEQKQTSIEKFYSYPIHRNIIAQCDELQESGYSKEELKIMQEPQKIMGDATISISATAVRVPVERGHCESVNISFENPFELEQIREILSHTPGVILRDNPKENIYPYPLYAKDKDEVFVGRVRRDFTYPNSLNLWIVADNLRKGAATNAIAIASHLIKEDLV